MWQLDYLTKFNSRESLYFYSVSTVHFNTKIFYLVLLLLFCTQLKHFQIFWTMMMNCFVVWLTDERQLALFPAGTIARDPHHHESPARREQGLGLRRT